MLWLLGHWVGALEEQSPLSLELSCRRRRSRVPADSCNLLLPGLFLNANQLAVMTDVQGIIQKKMFGDASHTGNGTHYPHLSSVALGRAFPSFLEIDEAKSGNRAMSKGNG